MPSSKIEKGARTAPVRHLTGADHFWLRMDDPTNLMMINGVMLFDEALSYERVREVLERRLLSIPRFRERVVVPRTGTAFWEPYADFDLDRHLLRERLPEPADDAALREFVSDRMSQPFDFDIPLWSFHLLENYRGGSAVVGRFHHCIGDGMGLMMVLLSLTDLEPDPTGSSPATENPFLALFQGAGRSIDAIREQVEQLMPEGIRLLLRPVEAFGSLGPVAKGTASLAALARLVLRPPDSRTPFNARIGVGKKAAWSDPLPFAEVKAVADRLRCTVNDLLLTATAGGLRRYILDRGDEALCRDFRATVPVNMRPLDALADLGNEFGLVYLSIPVEIADPLERLRELRRRMSKLKRSAESLVSLRVLSLMGRLPGAAQRALVKMFASKATAVVTNVPGPRQTLYFAGKPIRDVFFWVPRSGRLSLGISILSYAGRVRLGIASDAGLVPDPENLIEGFQRELRTMKDLAGPDDAQGAGSRAGSR